MKQETILFLTFLQSCWISTFLSSISWTSSPKALPSSQSYQNNEKAIINSRNWEDLKDKDFTPVALVQQEKTREGEQKADKRESQKSKGEEGGGVASKKQLLCLFYAAAHCLTTITYLTILLQSLNLYGSTFCSSSEDLQFVGQELRMWHRVTSQVEPNHSLKTKIIPSNSTLVLNIFMNTSFRLHKTKCPITHSIVMNCLLQGFHGNCII